MVAVMYDATDPGSIPARVPAPDYAMGYSNGRWPSADAMHALYPSAHPVTISAIPGAETGSEQGCDGETGDYSPPRAALWAGLTMLSRGIVPFIYCSFDNWHDYQMAASSAGILPTSVDWLIAAYPGIGPVPYPGSVGHQWVDWGDYDQSAIVDGWIPGRPIGHPPPPPHPAPPTWIGVPVIVPGQEYLMEVEFSTTTGLDGTAYVAMPVPAGCKRLIGGFVDVLDPSAFPSPQHDGDITENAASSALWRSGAVCEPTVGSKGLPAGWQRLRISGAIPEHFYTGHALFA